MAKTVLITGAAKRLGAACARRLHQAGYRVLLHYQHSETAALALVAELNQSRAESALALRADLAVMAEVSALAQQVLALAPELDGLINNAAQFFPGHVADVTEHDWNRLFDSNLKAPFFLTQLLLPALTAAQGSVVNIVDIYAQRPLRGYPVYSVSKAALQAMTQALARELAPIVRVNAVAPGAILWPETGSSEAAKAELLERVALQRCGEAEDIARAVGYLLQEAVYTTGQTLTVDGGRSLFI